MSDRSLAELARLGELEALATQAADDRSRLKWLWAALDFGHLVAETYLDDLLEVSSLRYDDSGYEQAAARWELAVAYLEGTEGLPVDLARARLHLIEASKIAPLAEINERTGAAAALLGRLTGEARSLLERAIANTLHDRYARAIERIELIRHMRSCQAPTVLVDAELERLQTEIAALADHEAP